MNGTKVDGFVIQTSDISMTKEKGAPGTSPFDFVKSILNNDEPIPITPAYSGFIVNRAIAHHRDTIFLSQIANEHQLSDEEHYSFLFHAIPKYRRSFEKWVSNKKDGEDISDLEMIAKYYMCSLDVAREYKAFLSKENIAEIGLIYGGKE